MEGGRDQKSCHAGETDWSLDRPRWLEIVGQRTEDERATHRERKISEALERSPLTPLAEN